MRILGIDPGIAIVGFGLIEAERGQTKLLNYGAITTPAGLPLARRLVQIEQDMEALIAQLKRAVAARVRRIRDYDALVADGDAETLAELAANRAVELVLGGMKEKIDVETMKACLEHIGKGSGR